MRSSRIWITGVGLVTALGPDVATTWPRLVSGVRGLAPLTLFDTAGQRASMVASVAPAYFEDASREGLTGDGAARAWSRTSAFAWKAVAEAMTHAGLPVAPVERSGDRRRLGLVVAGTTGGMFETEALLGDLHANPTSTASLVKMMSQPLTATGDRLVSRFGPFCRVRSLCSACSSGANAFVVGALWLLSGEVDAVVVGGTDGLCRLTVSGFNALTATDPDMCRPFDARRKGINLGEGAGFAVLERASSAVARGASVVAELSGWAIGAEAHHITQPDPSANVAARLIARSLRRGGLSPRDVDYVNAHGTGTAANDSMEAAALATALGQEIERIPVSSSKGQVGHMLGAAGAVEAIFSALAVKHQLVPPTMGLEEPDPACKLVHVLRAGRPARVRAVLSNSFGFGGMDTVLALTEPELGPPPARAEHERRVVVTGVAALSSRGLADAEDAATWVDGSLSHAGAPAPGPLAFDLISQLDPARVRRLDRPARLGAVVASRALAAAETGTGPIDRAEAGIVLGTAFGNLEASAAFMHRLFDKGPRLVSPAEFPNLVPSSPVGHVSIYLGLQGAAFATADLATSGECAVLQGMELVAGGEVDVVVAGAIEEASALVEKVLACLHGGASSGVPMPRSRARSEGASALVLEDEEHARLRGATPLARIERGYTWTDATEVALEAPRDPGRARVVVGRDERAAKKLIGTPWDAVRRTSLAPFAGDHEGLGGTALVAATSMVHRGLADEVLVVGTSNGRGYALLLVMYGLR